MYCPNCGTQNPDYFVYCKKCSEPLPKVNPEAAGEKHARRREESSVNILDANGPAYEPKQRHKAIDPWEMLREEKARPVERKKTELDELIEEQQPYERFTKRASVSVPEPSVKPRPHRLPEEYFNDNVIRPAAEQKAVQKPQPPKAEQPEEEPPKAEQAAPKASAPRAVVLPEEDAPADASATVRFERPARRQPAAEQAEKNQPAPRETKAAQPEGKRPAVKAGGRPAAAPKRPVQKSEPAKTGDEIDISGFFDDMDWKGGKSSKAARKKEERAEGKKRAQDEELAAPEKKKQKREKKPFFAKDDEELADVKRMAPEVPLEEDEGEEYEESGKRSPFTILIWVLVALLAAAIVFLAYRFISDGGLSGLFGSGETVQEQQVVIEEIDYQGQAAHSITVYGPDGSTVEFIDPSTGENLMTATMENGGYRLTVVDLNWIPNDASDLTVITVTPVIYVTEPEGVRTQVTSPSFNVPVPETSLSLTSPDISAPVVAEGNTLTLTGTVGANVPVQLLWNDQDISSGIDSSTGMFIAEVPLTEGVYTYELRAKLARHSDAVLTVEIDQTERTIELTALPSVSKTEEDETTVSGSTEAGATVTVDGAVSGDVTVNSDGSFSFTADLSSGYGVHPYVINAQSGNGSAVLTVNIVHEPDIDEYSRHAQVFDYSNVYNNPTDTRGIAYQVEGTLASVEQADLYQILTIYNEGNEDEPVRLYYFSDTTLSVGTEYRFFADANGNTELTETEGRMPLMNAWYASRN